MKYSILANLVGWFNGAAFVAVWDYDFNILYSPLVALFSL